MTRKPWECRVCGGIETCSAFSWRGYYRLRCENGHTGKLATPKQAARNFARLSRQID